MEKKGKKKQKNKTFYLSRKNYFSFASPGEHFVNEFIGQLSNYMS